MFNPGLTHTFSTAMIPETPSHWVKSVQNGLRCANPYAWMVEPLLKEVKMLQKNTPPYTFSKAIHQVNP